MNALIVGVGARAHSWIDVCQRHNEVELVAFVEPVAENRKAAADKYNLADSEFFNTLEDVKDIEADFVVDVTPPAVHERIALSAFERGWHYLGEKPMSDTFEAARRMVAAATFAGKTLMVTQNYRFGPVPRTTHRVLKEGKIGAPGQVTVGFYKAWASRQGTHYTTMPYPLLTDMGIHHFDMLRYVLDRAPLRVRAQTWNPAWKWHAGDAGHTAVFEFEGELMVTHHALGCSVGKQSPWNGDWRLEGPDGSLTWEEDRLFFTCDHPRERAAREELSLDEPSLVGQDALLAEFVSALKENRAPECSGADNLKSLAMVFAAIRSAKENRAVEMAELVAG